MLCSWDAEEYGLVRIAPPPPQHAHTACFCACMLVLVAAPPSGLPLSPGAVPLPSQLGSTEWVEAHFRSVQNKAVTCTWTLRVHFLASC